jgi:two-component system cell cycle sensor histidine kinase/response regulator CckA
MPSRAGYAMIHERDGAATPVASDASPNTSTETTMSTATLTPIGGAFAAMLERAENPKVDPVLPDQTLLQQLTDNLLDVLYLVDLRQNRMLFVNAAYERVWGRSCASLYADARSFTYAVHPDDMPALQSHMETLGRGLTPRPVEYRITLPDGRVRWILATTTPLYDDHGQIYRSCGIARDITEKREARAALEESEARFRKLTEASFDGIAVSQDGCMLDVNDGFLTTFGYSRADVIGQHVTAFCAPESVAMVEARVRDRMDGTYEFVGKRADGTHITLLATARLHEIGGRPARITALRDITAQRQLERQYRRAERMDAVGRLAGGVAHDFNNLLTIINAAAETIAYTTPETDPHRDDVRHIREAVSDAANLTRQLLSFSRHDAGQPSVVPFDDAIARGEALLRRVIGEDIVLRSYRASGDAVVLLEPGQLDQVLLNLAVNARDAMSDGGTLTIATDVVDLPDTSGDPEWPHGAGAFARLVVTDTGTGMTEETKARIFEPFFSTKLPGVGTGLGLATVYGIARKARGAIRVQSAVGMGSTFEMFFPIVNEVQDEAPVRLGPIAPGGGETVLIVEDSMAVRTVVRVILEREGYRVKEVEDGAAAVELLGDPAEVVDLVLSDMVMPRLSGRAMAEDLRRLRPNLGIIFMSGYAEPAERGDTPGSYHHFLQKPFSAEDLTHRVRYVLDAA